MKRRTLILLNLLVFSFSSFPVTSLAAEVAEPIVPEIQTEETVQDYNQQVDEYNQYVEEYNQAVDEQYEEEVIVYEENIEHNQQEDAKVAEVETYNQQEDETVAEINAEREAETEEKIQVAVEHNQEEDEKVKAVEDFNKQEEERVTQANEEKEQAEDARVAEAVQHNQEEDAKVAQNEEDLKQYEEDLQQYEEDLIQYEKDVVIKQRIHDLTGETVEEYNARIEAGNERTRELIPVYTEKNAEAKEVTTEETYEVEEATEKQERKIPVHIEHILHGTTVHLSDDFDIDANDTIILKALGASADPVHPDQNTAEFFYKTDEDHQQGYWSETYSVLMNNRTATVDWRWERGDVHIITYKDNTDEYEYANDDIHIVYNYKWNPLKINKTYNVPVEPTKPEEVTKYEPNYEDETWHVDYETPNYQSYTPDYWSTDYKTEYVTPEYKEYKPNYIEIVEPTKGTYLSKLDYLTYIPPKQEEEKVEDTTEEEKEEEEEYSAETPTPAAPEPRTITAIEEVIENDPEVIPLVSTIPTRKPLVPSVSEPAPAPVTDITEPFVPLAAPAIGYWALWNLIFTILVIIESILLIITYFFKKKHQENEEEEEEYTIKKYLFRRLIHIILSIVTVIIFILTEDITLPMKWVDKYTLLMFILFIVNTIICIFSKKTKEEENEEDYN